MLEDEIRELEAKLLTRAVRSSPDALEGLISDDFREFGSSGREHSKRDVIAALLAAPEPPAGATTGTALADFRAVEVAPGVALATYRTPGSLRSSIWRREGDAWRILFHQGTKATE